MKKQLGLTAPLLSATKWAFLRGAYSCLPLLLARRKNVSNVGSA